jgi:hypothetical protein
MVVVNLDTSRHTSSSTFAVAIFKSSKTWIWGGIASRANTLSGRTFPKFNYRKCMCKNPGFAGLDKAIVGFKLKVGGIVVTQTQLRRKEMSECRTRVRKAFQKYFGKRITCETPVFPEGSIIHVHLYWADVWTPEQVIEVLGKENITAKRPEEDSYKHLMVDFPLTVGIGRDMKPKASEIRKLMSWLGSRTSKAKAKAARINGCKGGRPKKK